MRPTRRERAVLWLEEARYALSSRFRLTLAVTGWLCRRSIHFFEFDEHAGRNPWLMEPGEPGWECRYCLAGGYPMRFRLSDWAWSHAPLRWVAEWQAYRWSDTE